MGLRGPLPRVQPIKQALIVQEVMTPPAGLSPEELHIFDCLVDENRAAGVPQRQVDASLYADLASATVRRALADDDRVWLALTRQIEEIRGQLCMGPRSRARAGLKDTAAPVAVSAMARVLELAKSQR
jgi:hypothetical protein